MAPQADGGGGGGGGAPAPTEHHQQQQQQQQQDAAAASAPEVRTTLSVRLTERSRIHAALLLVQLGYAGYAVLTRVALTAGLSRFIFPIYRNGLAVLLLAPAAWYLEHRGRRGSLGPAPLARVFVLGLLGIFGNQALYLAGLQYTSATTTSLMQNLVPVFAFLLAAAFRLEQVRCRRRDGAAKWLGTAACVAGAVVVGAYRGPALIGSESPAPVTVLLEAPGLGVRIDSWHAGVLCLVGNTLSWAAYLTLQVPVLAAYPAPVSLAALVSLCGTAQLAALALAVVPLVAADWVPAWGAEVVGVAYSGVVASGINIALQTWCVQRGGPLLVAVYEPLQCVVVAVLALVFLGDSLHLGTVLGGLLIVLGLYLVTWGQVESDRLARLQEEQQGGGVKQPLLSA